VIAALAGQGYNIKRCCRILGVALSRTSSSNDFTDAERDLLNHARPFLIQAYRNAIRYSEALAAQTPRRNAPRIPEQRRLVALGLTGRQAEVLQLLAIGATERDIATRLQISHRTVQKHLERCYRRLNVTNRSHAGAIAWSTIDAKPPNRATKLPLPVHPSNPPLWLANTPELIGGDSDRGRG